MIRPGNGCDAELEGEVQLPAEPALAQFKTQKGAIVLVARNPLVWLRRI
jgi:hypothetical protein